MTDDATTPTMDDVIAEQIAAHPEPAPQAQAIVRNVLQRDDDQRATGSPSPSSRAAGEPDAFGAPFDPIFHDGTITKRGSWRKRRKPLTTDDVFVDPGPSSAARDAVPHVDASSVTPIDPPPPPVDHRAIAQKWLDRAFKTSAMIFGEKWSPSEMERTDLIDATAALFSKYGWSIELPPELALLIAIGTYFFARLVPPEAMMAMGQRIAGKMGLPVQLEQAA